MRDDVYQFIKKHDIISRVVSGGLCFIMFILVLVAFASPVITVSRESITPFNLIFSFAPEDIEIFSVPTLLVSYYAYKYFYMAAGIAMFILFALAVYFVVTNKKRASIYFNYFMAVMTLFLFINMLFGLNYINIYDLYGWFSLSTGTVVFFVAGLLILIAKFITSVIFDRTIMREDHKDAGMSIAMAFILISLIFSTLVTPLYIFPGTIYRMRGVDILFGGSGDDALYFLRMSGVFRGFIAIFLIISFVSFLTTVVLFFVSRKIFVRYTKVNTFIGITALCMYALMGFNYMIVYFEYLVLGPESIYNYIFSGSMLSYSYLPLMIYLLLMIGIAFAKISGSRIKIEYKVVAQGGGGESRNAVAVNRLTALDDDAGFDPIPAFSELDSNIEKYNSEYNLRTKRLFQGVTLPKLVKHIIDYAKNSKERLSYGHTEIKTFVAGIAASRLTILQGMSGTGKTSLPKIFMEAIDGTSALVAVESSWRDKNELLGYYNEFSRKFTPKAFTQFLYKASLNPKIPYFIVLDELNLSRIEYYFSDFLSLMEARENERFIKLFDVQLYPDYEKKYLALRDGHTIDIPINMWFVGTSNRDESTFEISDKVYDRAQTMNFDKRAPKIVSERIDIAPKFVPYETLQGLFDEALKFEFDAERYDVIGKAEKLLRPYKISFGNRVLKQMEDFVKVYTACSGKDTERHKYIHEAVDCIVFSKIVRKLELKQIMDVDILIDQFDKLELPKCVEFLRSLSEDE